MRNQLEKAIRNGTPMIMIYRAKDGQCTKRAVTVLQTGEFSFKAYCHMRHAKRTFLIDRVLALFPVIEREKAVL
ncbi:hypothetical protein NCCP2716_01190 [Sporosarcina sp. NCCP-2716]|uniref:WYL domain-containing protein n=1 Tax=Sporosarcina sp. NCCP-2716 TaxID=2943679 RepID=UPI00203AD9DA|nr:transcriptional regulator [Sporosarcina sp. NCCP-2716]GKV67621.1 hypothetical protein NCCP2716_01190 [Sporosarcina sp. NCCP-2716]